MVNDTVNVVNLSECWVASPGFVRVSSEGGHVELFEAPDGNLVPPPAVKLCVRFPIARLLSSLKEACQSEEVAATGLSGRYQRSNQQDVHPTYSNPEELIRYHGFGVFFMVFIFSL